MQCSVTLDIVLHNHQALNDELISFGRIVFHPVRRVVETCVIYVEECHFKTIYVVYL